MLPLERGERCTSWIRLPPEQPPSRPPLVFLCPMRCMCSGRVQCGIIYCLSRKDCQKVADALREHFPEGGRPKLAIG